MKARLLKWLIAADIWVMFHLFGGKEGETMSAAAWNAHITGRFWGWAYLLIDLLAYPLERDHCRKSWLSVEGIYA
jgi:hypothetical protein